MASARNGSGCRGYYLHTLDLLIHHTFHGAVLGVSSENTISLFKLLQHFLLRCCNSYVWSGYVCHNSLHTQKIYFSHLVVSTFSTAGKKKTSEECLQLYGHLPVQPKVKSSCKLYNKHFTIPPSLVWERGVFSCTEGCSVSACDYLNIHCSRLDLSFLFLKIELARAPKEEGRGVK